MWIFLKKDKTLVYRWTCPRCKTPNKEAERSKFVICHKCNVVGEVADDKNK